MKSLTFCTCMIATLLVASAAFGEIVFTYDWDSDEYGDYWFGRHNSSETNTDVLAYINGGDPSSWVVVDGWRNYSLTEGCTCDWEYELDTYAKVEAERTAYEPHSAHAYAYAYANGQTFDPTYSSAEVELDEDFKPEESNPDDFDEGTNPDDSGNDYFTAGQGMYSYHHIEIEADVTSDDITKSHAWAYAFCDLEENAP